MQYAYPCRLTHHDDEGGGYLVSFPDVPEAITGARTREESLVLAKDALAVALGAYVSGQEEIPVPSQVPAGDVLVPVRAIVAAKLALYTAMRRQRLTKDTLASRLGLNESAVRRLLNPSYLSRTVQVEQALRAVGRHVVVKDRATNQPRRRVITPL